jgi:hypothetical protein
MNNDIDFLKEVLSIPTKTYEEDLMIDFLVDWMKKNRIPFSVDEYGNVYATKQTDEVDEHFIFPCVVAHTDTVHKIDTINIREEVLLNEQNEFSLSAVYEPTQDFFGYQSNTMYYAPLISNPLSYVTLTATGLIANHFKVAPTTTLGLNYRFQFTDIKKGNQSRKSEISVHASFNTADWTKFKSISEGVEKDYHFQATTKTTIGLQYSPEIFNNDKAANGNILEKTKYRFGAYSYNLPFTQNNLNIVDKGLTIGLGIPILTQRSQSSVNLGFAYGNRGTSDKTLLTEKYYSINIGLTFAPSIFERWFVKRKLD